MNCKRSVLYLSFLFFTSWVNAQIGGRHVYDFLNLSTGPSVTALGGVNVSSPENDLQMAYQNPALCSDSMDNQLVLSYTDYLADIGFGYVGFGKTFEGVGSFHTGVQLVNYGEFQETDELGNRLGTFSASDWAWVIGGAREWGRLRYGAQVKVIASQLAPGFSSLGIATDLGASFHAKNKLLTAGLVVRNIGVQLTPYADTDIRESLPTQVIIGVSNRLKYMPFRFSLTAIHLERPKLVLEDPDQPIEVDLNGNEIDTSPSGLDRVFRHLVFGGEFLLGKALRLRMGYNHMRRQELRSINRGGMTGFSLGTGIRLKRLYIDYGFGSYGLNGLFHTHQFGIGINFNPPNSTSG